MEVAALILWELRHSGNCDFLTPNSRYSIVVKLFVGALCFQILRRAFSNRDRDLSRFLGQTQTNPQSNLTGYEFLLLSK